MGEPWGQRDFGVRFDWGSAGADAIVAANTIAVVVDVLSFTTTLSVALDRDVSVIPYRWNDADGAQELADRRGATLARPRSRAVAGEASLSPMSIRSVASLSRLVLPSPNGSALAHQIAQDDSNGCVGASLRNARAVARWIVDQVDDSSGTAAATRSVAVVAAGERWPDGSLRPAVEDLWGGGGLICALKALGFDDVSPEAESAAVAYEAASGDIGSMLRECASGRELIESGFGSDVEIAAEVDESTVVPLLVDGEFVRA